MPNASGGVAGNLPIRNFPEQTGRRSKDVKPDSLISCSSAPDIHLPDPLPAAIREHKNLLVFGTRRKINTGIYLNQGDTYSIMATGSISKDRRRKLGPKSPDFQKYIGEERIGAAFSWGTNGSMCERRHGDGFIWG